MCVNARGKETPAMHRASPEFWQPPFQLVTARPRMNRHLLLQMLAHRNARTPPGLPRSRNALCVGQTPVPRDPFMLTLNQILHEAYRLPSNIGELIVPLLVRHFFRLCALMGVGRVMRLHE